MVRSAMIGARVRRKEDPRLITGSSMYVDDLQLTGMAHLVLLRSPYAHATDQEHRHLGREIRAGRDRRLHQRGLRSLLAAPMPGGGGGEGAPMEEADDRPRRGGGRLRRDGWDGDIRAVRADIRRRRSGRWRAARCAGSASRSSRSSPSREAQGRDAAEAGRGRLRGAAGRHRPRGRAGSPARRASGTASPTTSASSRSASMATPTRRSPMRRTRSSSASARSVSSRADGGARRRSPRPIRSPAA